MSAFSETALAHHADETLSSSAGTLITAVPDRVEREAAAAELRQDFCAHLKAARQRKGITLQAISEATKVSEGLFADLERGHLARWPTGIYRRAFVREYALFVGLPAESTVSEFVRLFPEERERGPAQSALVPGPLRLTLARSPWVRRSLVHAQAAAIDVLIVFILSIGLGWLVNLEWPVSVALVALCYYAGATAFLGHSPATWWIRYMAHHRRGRRFRLAR